MDLSAQWNEIREPALSRIDEVLKSGNYLQDECVTEFENKIAEFLGSRYCVSLNSGTDALIMALYALGIGRGDEVITIANSFIASVSAIVHVGAKPIFVDVGEDHLIDVRTVSKALSAQTKAILVVHLEGKTSDMKWLVEFAKANNLFLIEDSAQAFGSSFNGQFAGTFGDIGCFSLHPLKNFNALGDGGFIVTDHFDIFEKIRQMSNHGQVARNESVSFGQVSRLDSLQAAVLLLKLNFLEDVMSRRSRNAKLYDEILGNSSTVKIPFVSDGSTHTYHLYVVEIEDRENIMQKLWIDGIQTKIHYPTLIPDQVAYKSRFEDSPDIPITRIQSKRILSLPIHQNLKDEQIEYVAKRLLFHTANNRGSSK